MRRLLYAGLASLLVLQAADAQGVLQRPRYQSPVPTTSPYLNMTRGGNPGINYYGTVRPQMETSRTLQGLQTELQMAENAMYSGVPSPGAAGGSPPAISTTGHPIAFFNTSHYFPAPGQRPGAFSGTGTASSQGSPGAGTTPSLGLGLTSSGVQPILGFGLYRR